MKRFFSVVLFGAGVAVLAGCPIYPDNAGDYRVCDGNACYDCPDNYYSGACVPWQCSDNRDCPGGYACNDYGTCGGGPSGGYVDASVPTGCTPYDCPAGESCGSDNQCHSSGDCSNNGCPVPFVCELSGGTLQCVPPSGFDAGPLPDGGRVDTGPPPDSGFTGCQSDADCSAVPGAKCLDGTCVAPADQCFDGTQCPAGDQCVAGVCTPTCGDAGKACPTGYTCDKNGVCGGNPTPCEGADANVCVNGTVCAQNHCASPCGDGGTCPVNEVCVQGGCVPDGRPQFTCAKEGVQGACATGSVCLHHSCYIGCDPEAGNACKSADQFNQCKAVATSTGSYFVCGSSSNLGSECDPTQGKQCTSPAICIDGYCR